MADDIKDRKFVDLTVHHDCQDSRMVAACYSDIGVGPAVVFDGGAFTDHLKLRNYAADLQRMARWLERASVASREQRLQKEAE